MPLVVLNLTRNLFRGIIPSEIGNIKCLQNLDFSFNNFSGIFPTSLNNLTELSKFNISYNPSISGVIPITGQLATFERDSFLGNPLLVLPKFISNSSDRDPKDRESGKEKTVVHTKWGAFLIFSVLVLAILICGGLSFVIHILGKTPQDTYLLQEGNKFGVEFLTGSSSSDTVKIIRLDKTAFTHADILSATENFSERRIVGRGGFGTVYRGVLPNGRQVAVKKLLREGIEGEKEFRAEMEVLTGNGGHPNLVALHGWCLDGCQRILVYEFMEGGALEDLATTKGDVYSYGVLLMELATGRRAVDGGEEECLVEWARRVMVSGGGGGGGGRGMVSATEGAAEMWELLRIGVRCTAEAPQRRPNMKEVLGMLVKMLAGGYGGVDLPPPR
ncbi:Probable LRR receptor-like serine/threonine-protein kinase At1g74360 [Linum perenne]